MSGPDTNTLEMVRRIESAWASGSAPDLRAVLAGCDESNQDAWAAVLVGDAECRAERGLGPTLGHYLELFPWLAPGSRAVQELLAIEISELAPSRTGVGDFSRRYAERFSGDVTLVLDLLGLFKPVSTRAEPIAGQRLGKYELTRALGRGSFGQVWLAWDHELTCFIALKLIAPSGDVDRRMGSLLVEARAASGLNHPNVIGVRAVGRFRPPDDWLYIDMQVCGDPAPTAAEPKLIAVGQPLPEWVEQMRPGVKETARLAAEACRGVVAAHAQGVVHCDIKPANVLVTPSGRAMVADFGLSSTSFLPTVRESGARESNASISVALRTASGRTIRGTPAYMSPEQARGEPARPISDVYGLGAILFWLLTGTDPYRSVNGEQLTALLKRIGDFTLASPALPPSTHPTLARICNCAMSKDQSQRYPSASTMLADLDAFLSRRVPPTVGPDSAIQPLALWAKRNALPVAIGSAAVLGLATLSLVALSQSREAANQRDAATSAARAERERADELEAVSSFQARILEEMDPTSAGVKLTEDVLERLEGLYRQQRVPEGEIPKRMAAFREQWRELNATDVAKTLIGTTMLKPAVHAIEQQFKTQPTVDAKLRQVLARLYRDIGLYQQATPLQEQALDTRRRVLGEGHPDTLRSLSEMGVLLRAQESKLAEAEKCSMEAMEASRYVLGQEHPDTLQAIANMGDVLRVQRSKRKLEQAAPYHLEALEKRCRVLGEANPNTLTSIGNMGNLLLAMGKPYEAEPYLRESLELRRRVLGEDHPSTLTALNAMAGLMRLQGRLDLAASYFSEALSKFSRVMGKEHPYTITAMNNLGSVLMAQGKFDEAEPYVRETLEKRRSMLTRDHRDTLTAVSSMGNLLMAQGKLTDAEPYLREALEKRQSTLELDHPDVIASLNDLGILLRVQGNLEEAESKLREALDRAQRVWGEDHPRRLVITSNLGAVLCDRAKFIEALKLLEPIEPRMRAAFTGDNVSRLGMLLTSVGRARAGLGFDPDRYRAAEASLLEAHSILAGHRGTTQLETTACVRGLAELYEAWSKEEPDRGYGTKAATWKSLLPRSE